MTGLVRKATLLCVGGLLLAGAAMAGIPSAANSTIPTCILLADAQSNSNCNFMVIRDANNNPVAGSSVTLDFSACITGDVKLCDTQFSQATTVGGASTQPAAVVCGSKTITVSADALGQLCVALNGGTNLANGHGPAPGNRPTCCTIYADSKIMGTVVVTVATFDFNTNAAINSADLSTWLSYAGGAFGAYRSKADYTCDGAVNSGDLSKWLVCAGLGLPAASIGCASFCP
jgi:hypothetical protein